MMRSQGGKLPSFNKNVDVSQNKVLGATQTTLQGAVKAIQPAFQQVVTTVSEGISSTAEHVLIQDQKIEIDKAIEDVKKNAANIPERVVEEAKFNYCKQVVQDYESSH